MNASRPVRQFTRAIGSQRCSVGRWLALGCAAVIAFGVGCGTGPGSANDPDLLPFDSEQAMCDYLNRQVEPINNGGVTDLFLEDVAFGAPADAADGQAAPDQDRGNGAGDFSTTNLQEEGVGEADIVHTDGTYLFIVDEQSLQIIQATPADQMRDAARLELGHQVNLMYRYQNRAILLGSTTVVDPVDPVDDPVDGVGDSPETEGDIAYFEPYYRQMSTVTVIDIEDPTQPKVIAEQMFDGWTVTSRMIDERLYLVLNTYLSLGGSDPADRPLSEILPDRMLRDADGVEVSADLVSWDDLYHPPERVETSITAVVSLDVTDPTEEPHAVGVLGAAGHIVYVSRDSLYLARNYYEAVSGPMFFRNELQTVIHRFALDPEQGATPAGRGMVPGSLLNRYAMSEYQGYLRVASTVDSFGDQPTNQLNVLDATGAQTDLEIVGSITDLAPGERIYAARYLQDRGFLVTFKRIDPLFTLDLSDPFAPRVVGELKVPGYSDYIHPLDGDQLLTIGKDAIDDGQTAWYQGVQLSLFDVSAFADPQRMDVETVGDRGTESEALYEPHAFNYYAPLGVLAVPMRIAEKAYPDPEPWSHGEIVFVGVCFYRISPEGGIEDAGRLRTAESAPWYYGGGWTRNLFIGERYYAVTNGLVQSLPTSDFSAEPIELRWKEPPDFEFPDGFILLD